MFESDRQGFIWNVTTLSRDGERTLNGVTQQSLAVTISQALEFSPLEDGAQVNQPVLRPVAQKKAARATRIQVNDEIEIRSSSGVNFHVHTLFAAQRAWG